MLLSQPHIKGKGKMGEIQIKNVTMCLISTDNMSSHYDIFGRTNSLYAISKASSYGHPSPSDDRIR